MTLRLTFVLEIQTDLVGADDDEVAPAIIYVCDWLNDNGYGYIERPAERAVKVVRADA